MLVVGPLAAAAATAWAEMAFATVLSLTQRPTDRAIAHAQLAQVGGFRRNPMVHRHVRVVDNRRFIPAAVRILCVRVHIPRKHWPYGKCGRYDCIEAWSASTSAIVSLDGKVSRLVMYLDRDRGFVDLGLLE